ncbi:hypothetical protein HDU89_002374 [Geranomyces variabilis]|nr:hypothetical protein HDU89_002374 [Geranomyces variabilis]
MPKDLAMHRAIGVYVETVAAVAFGALTHHDGYCQARENAGFETHSELSWKGTNNVVPIAGFGSSQLSGHRVDMIVLQKFGRNLPAAFVARVVKICVSEAVVSAMEQAYRGNWLDVAGLPVAERSDKSPVCISTQTRPKHLMAPTFPRRNARTLPATFYPASATASQATTDERARSVWDDLRKYAEGSMWKDAFLMAIDGAERSVNDARRAKAAFEADSAGFEDMARTMMDAAAASGPSPGFLRGLCGDVSAILQSNPLRKTLLLDGHFQAFLPPTLAARLVAQCCSAKELRAMEMAYYTATLDVSDLPIVTRSDQKPAVYLHAGRPRSFDGPNQLPSNTDLVYVGSGQGPRGIFARVFLNHLKASVRRNGPSTHYTSFYGSANGAPAGWAPRGPAPDQTDYFVVARIPRELAKHYGFVMFIETVAAVAFGALHGHDGYIEARANAGLADHSCVPWTGTNGVVPLAGFGSSREGGHRGGTTHSRRIRSAQLGKVLSAQGYEAARQPRPPAAGIPASCYGQCAIGVATGTWNANPSLPSIHAPQPKVRVEIGKMVLRMRAAARERQLRVASVVPPPKGQRGSPRHAGPLKRAATRLRPPSSPKPHTACFDTDEHYEWLAMSNESKLATSLTRGCVPASGYGTGGHWHVYRVMERLPVRAAPGERQYELKVSFPHPSVTEVHFPTMNRLSEPAPGSVLAKPAYRQLHNTSSTAVYQACSIARSAFSEQYFATSWATMDRLSELAPGSVLTKAAHLQLHTHGQAQVGSVVLAQVDADGTKRQSCVFKPDMAETALELRRVLGLVDASDPDYKIPDGTSAIYIRSLSLTISELQRLVQLFRHRFHHPLFLAKLEALLEKPQEQQQQEQEQEQEHGLQVHVRYIGTCRGPTAPFDRHRHDLPAPA